MAEQEVVKHTKKVYTIMKDKEHRFLYKLREFLLEIFIIVFAISVSLWFHNWSEHRKEQSEVKTFLTGLRKDLQADIVEMKDDQQSYNMQQNAYRYLYAIKYGKEASKDSLSKYFKWIFNTTALNPNNGRFEGFKSAGKLGSIENEILQNDILDLYQENIPSLLTATNGYISRKTHFFEQVERNLQRRSDSTTNMTAVLNSEIAHNIAGTLSYTQEITGRYQNTIAKMQKIIAEIDKFYPTVGKK